MTPLSGELLNTTGGAWDIQGTQIFPHNRIVLPDAWQLLGQRQRVCTWSNFAVWRSAVAWPSPHSHRNTFDYRKHKHLHCRNCTSYPIETVVFAVKDVKMQGKDRKFLRRGVLRTPTATLAPSATDLRVGHALSLHVMWTALNVRQYTVMSSYRFVLTDEKLASEVWFSAQLQQCLTALLRNYLSVR
jgi:hypothetical protein